MRDSLGAILRALDLDVYGLGARLPRGFQNADLLVDAAVKPPLILPSAAGSQNHAVGPTLEKLADSLHPALRRGQVVQAKFQEALSGFVFGARVIQQRLDVLEPQRYADLGKNCA